MLAASVVLVALAFGFAVLVFQNPVRGVVALALSSGASAGALGLVGGAAVVGPVIWLSSTAAALLLYLAVLLNLSQEERGARRVSLRRTGALAVAAFSLSAVDVVVVDVAPEGLVARPSGASLAAALVGPLGPLVVLSVLTLGVAVMAALMIARRRT